MKTFFSKLTRRSAALTLAVAVAAGSAVAFTQKSKDTPQLSPVSLAVDKQPVQRDGDGRHSFAPVIKKVSPAVVKIVTTSKGANAGPGAMDQEELLRRFFGDESRGMVPNGRAPKRSFNPPRRSGLGSGVIVTKDGYILTNNHVVENTDEVKVTLLDGREFNAKIIGRDPRTDVAVIKINGADLPAIPTADSDQVEVGDIVLAIGHPFGIGQTVTTGIVSAKDRSGGNVGLDYEDFIQTDAAINPGNSGGALVDADGRLIGINTAILSRSGGNQGIGFAIPVNLARDIMESLVNEGHVTRGYLGVMIQDLTPALAQQFKVKETGGALIGDVSPKGPAEKAGFKSGDVIVEFNGKPVSDSQRLRLEVARTKPGSTVPVKVIRDEAAKTLQVTVKEAPGSESVAKADQPEKDSGTLNGVGVADIDAKARQEFEIPETVNGAVITDVEPDSPAAEAGLKSGDVIQEINRHAVKSSEEAVRLTDHPKDKVTLLRIWRKGGSHFVIVDETQAG